MEKKDEEVKKELGKDATEEAIEIDRKEEYQVKSKGDEAAKVEEEKAPETELVDKAEEDSKEEVKVQG